MQDLAGRNIVPFAVEWPWVDKPCDQKTQGANKLGASVVQHRFKKGGILSCFNVNNDVAISITPIRSNAAPTGMVRH